MQNTWQQLRIVVGDETPKNTFILNNSKPSRSQYSSQNTCTNKTATTQVHVVRCLTTTSFFHNVSVQCHKSESQSPLQTQHQILHSS